MYLPTAVAVVIPARDEEELLPSCLTSVARAVDELAAHRPGILCRIFVVLDSCEDGSAEVVALRPGVTAVLVQAGCVGAARAAGVEAAADWAGEIDPTTVWVANTDADGTVPRTWLDDQMQLADAGHELVIGVVEPTPGDLTPAELATWRARHSVDEGHDHVHGANLGFSLAAYVMVGGFRPLPVHEDVELVSAMRAAGVTEVATGALLVTTSGRRHARAPDGFAAYLNELGA